jgi:hypothetical protein
MIFKTVVHLVLNMHKASTINLPSCMRNPRSQVFKIDSPEAVLERMGANP